jgi:pyruvate carboxylase
MFVCFIFFAKLFGSNLIVKDAEGGKIKRKGEKKTKNENTKQEREIKIRNEKEKKRNRNKKKRATNGEQHLSDALHLQSDSLFGLGLEQWSIWAGKRL